MFGAVLLLAAALAALGLFDVVVGLFLVVWNGLLLLVSTVRR